MRPARPPRPPPARTRAPVVSTTARLDFADLLIHRGQVLHLPRAIRPPDQRARFSAERGQVRPCCWFSLVIGAGFIGSEVASVRRELGLAVTVAEVGEAPLVGALGGVIGRNTAQMHRDHGVDLRTGVSVTFLEGDANGHLCSASLSDGSTLDVDVAVTALGSIRNVEWLEGPAWRPARGASAATPAAAPSTSTAWRPTAST